MDIVELVEPRPFNVIFTPKDQDRLRKVLYAASLRSKDMVPEVIETARRWYLDLCKAQGLEPARL